MQKRIPRVRGAAYASKNEVSSTSTIPVDNISTVGGGGNVRENELNKKTVHIAEKDDNRAKKMGDWRVEKGG